MRGSSSKGILEQLRRLARKKIELEKTPHEFGGGVVLQHAEMYLLETLANDEGQNLTRIAEHMQITKGAVSQTLKKIEEKGLVRKFPDPANASRALLYLSPKGKKVVRVYRQRYQRADGEFIDYLEGLKEGDVQTIRDFLNRYEFFLDNHKR